MNERIAASRTSPPGLVKGPPSKTAIRAMFIGAAPVSAHRQHRSGTGTRVMVFAAHLAWSSPSGQLSVIVLIARRSLSQLRRITCRSNGDSTRNPPRGNNSVRTASRHPPAASVTWPQNRTPSRREVLTAAQLRGGSNAVFSIMAVPTPRPNRTRYRVPAPIGPGVSFSASRNCGFHSGSRRTSVT